jgi:hypothetical protein
MEEISEKVKELEELKVEFEKRSKELIKASIDIFFENNPLAEAVVWKQYTPSFNDGDPCTLNVGEVFAYIPAVEGKYKYTNNYFSYSSDCGDGEHPDNADQEAAMIEDGNRPYWACFKDGYISDCESWKTSIETPDRWARDSTKEERIASYEECLVRGKFLTEFRRDYSRLFADLKILNEAFSSFNETLGQVFDEGIIFVYRDKVEVEEYYQ